MKVRGKALEGTKQIIPSVRGGWAALALVFLLACAKDKDNDSYRREKVQKDLARLQVAEGRYTGLVTSQSDGSRMGALEITIKTETRTSPGGASGTSADSSAVLIANLRFVANKSVSVTAQNAYYDPDKKDFNAQVNITRPDGQVETLSVNGVIPGETFEGSLEASNYQGYGGKFVLRKNGASPESLLGPGQGENADRPLYSRSFKSFTTFFRDNGIEKDNTVPASLVVLQASTTPEQDFLNTFVPVKNVQVSVNYSDSLKLIHSQALWDQRNHTLVGSATMRDGDSSESINLGCVSSGTDQDLAWTCQHSSNSGGHIATTKTFFDNRVVRDTVGASAAAVQVNFNKGTAKFRDHSGQTRSIPVRFRALLPTRTRDQRLSELFFPVRARNLSVTLSLFVDTGSPVNISFNLANTKWDIGNSSLESSETNVNFTATLSCSNFKFDASREAFDCQYFATNAADIFYLKITPQ